MNALVLMCDHLRYDAIGFHGNPHIDTPNLDRLAARSVRFTRAFCNSPLCGPTRHSLATGLYPYEHGVINNQYLPNEGMRTVAHELRDRGLRTGCFGHMHWQRRPVDDSLGDVFPDHGYEVYHAVTADRSALDERQKAELMWENLGATSKRVAGASGVPEELCFSKQIADASIRKLREWKAGGERFLSWTSFDDPHPPFFPSGTLYAKYAARDLPPPLLRPPGASPSQEEVCGDPVWARMTPLDHRAMKAGYYGLIEQADRHLGRVLDALDELDLWKDTMVLFTVDHGDMMGDFGRYFKSVMWEQAVHMPFFIYHPGIAPGECDALVEHVDVLPTLCDCLGFPIPEGRRGRSLKPLLARKTAPADWREYALAQLGEDVMVRTSDWKLVYQRGEPVHLFDLANDSHEFHNLLAARPDKARELAAVLDRDHPALFQTTQAVRAAGRFRKKKRKPRIVLGEFA